MATNSVFDNTTLTYTAQSAHAYLLNDFIMRADARRKVFNDTTSAPPGSPSFGIAYIIASGASGAWAGKEKNLAISYGSTWTYIAPYHGLSVYNTSLDTEMLYDGSNWTYPEYIKDAGSLGTGTHNIDTKYGGTYFVFSSSGVTVTLNVASIVYGRQFIIYAQNPNGSSCTLDFQTSEWLGANFSFSVASGRYITLVYTLAPGGSLEIVSSVLNGGIAI